LNHLEQVKAAKHKYNTSEERKAYMRAYMKKYNLDAEKYEKAKERMRQYSHRKWFEAKEK
jgi:phosphoribosylamine-glycine ligase